MLAAVFLGGIIGYEREYHGKAAGFRTHILVCLGATVIMISPDILSKSLPYTRQLTFVGIDPGRMVAGIVTGIGFLGAGAILRMGDVVRGLTTAAGIWFTAAVGILIGGGYLLLASVCTLLGLIVLLAFDWLEHPISPLVHRNLTVQIRDELSDKVQTSLLGIFAEYKIRLEKQDITWQKSEDVNVFVYHLRLKSNISGLALCNRVKEMDSVQKVEWN
jgi:putative Mg2+ transporter-C (MgtC) family protein